MYAGATNVLRVAGKKASALTFLLDFCKCVASVLVGYFLVKHACVANGVDPEMARLGMYAAGFCCMIGHMYPLYFGFRGGKGILSSAALAIMMDWRIFVIGFSLFLIIVFATHYVSLGSILAATAYAVLFVIFFPGQPWIWSIAIAMAVLAIFMHRSNIARLLHGTETKTYLLKSKKK